MKTIQNIFATVLIFAFCFMPAEILAEKVGFEVGLDYESTYFWRGVSFYGDCDGRKSSSRGAFFPRVGYSIGDFNLMLLGEIPAESLGDGATELENEWLGLDFINTWSRPFFNEGMTLELGMSYFYYPNSRKEKYGNGTSDDSIETLAGITANKIPLSPGVKVKYSYHMKEQWLNQKIRQDFYFELFAGHGFTIQEGATLTLGGSAGTFYYPSASTGDKAWLEKSWQKVSDVKFFANLSVSTSGGMTVYGKYSYAVVPSVELADVSGRHHHWASFGISYLL